MHDSLVLVDENDNEIGVLDKTSVHQRGILHRAFSAFIFNTKGELLIQQRADEKYHSAGLWSNTCCSHPYNGEKISDAVNRRLKEEMGLQCTTHFKFCFTYKTDFDNGLIEHEYDHVYFGESDDLPLPNKEEVKAFKYITLKNLEEEISLHPQKFTIWMKICLPKILQQFQQ